MDAGDVFGYPRDNWTRGPAVSMGPLQTANVLERSGSRSSPIPSGRRRLALPRAVEGGGTGPQGLIEPRDWRTL